jgi:hypothetical protein
MAHAVALRTGSPYLMGERVRQKTVVLRWRPSI